MEPGNVFKADAQAVKRLFIQIGRGFYVPAYQRPYAWDANSVQALLENLIEGLNLVPSDADALTFLGTMIFVHDTQYKTVEPQVTNELPSQVYLVIDGQQRLSTLSICFICLHNQILRYRKRLPKDASYFRWANHEAGKVLQSLHQCLFEEQSFGEKPFTYYPRIIRAHVDQWGSTEEVARYASPIARAIFSYVRHSFDAQTQGKPFTEKMIPDEKDAETYKLMVRNFKRVRDCIRRLEVGNGIAKEQPDIRIPAVTEFIQNPELYKRFFNANLEPEVSEALQDPSHEGFHKLFRLCVLACYLLERAVVTQVLVNNEDYAFDMFEALNTTGEPLTSYDTFKPNVIREETLEKFRTTPSAESLQQVEQFLDRFEGADKRRKACNQLLIPFAMYEDGTKLSKRLRDQRNWLRRTYERAEGIEDKRRFLHGMARVAEYRQWAWPEGALQANAPVPGGMDLGKEADTCLLCLETLRAANHHITIGPLSIFLSQALDAPPSQRESKIAEFVAAVKATTAFFALWRGSRVGTAGIDQRYRVLMKEGLSSSDIPPFARLLRDKKEGAAPPSSEELRQFYRESLREAGIENRTQWVDLAAKLDVYQQSRHLCKFLLIVASHNGIPSREPGDEGLVKRGKDGACPTMNLQYWHRHFTVEHIAPQKPLTGDQSYEKAIYSDDAQHRLGNLTLLPQVENSSMANRPWPQKLLYFRALAAESLDDVKLALEKFQDATGTPPPATSKEILGQGSFLPHVRALALLDTQKWTQEHVKRRSENLAKLAWDTIAPWLGL